LKHSRARSGSACMLKNTIFGGRASFRMVRTASRPFKRGIVMSVTITSGCSIRENSRSALPLSTSPTTSYLELSKCASVSIKTLWSSANNTRRRVVPSRVDMCSYTSRALHVAQCGVFRKHSEKLPATSRTCPDTGHTRLSLQCAHEAATKRANLGTRGNSESGRGRLHIWISPRSYGSDASTAHRRAIANGRRGAAE